MLVWLVHIGELLPVDRPFRPFRYTWLAESLVRAGHRVVRWAPTFAHALKRQRYESDARVEVEPGYALELLSAPTVDVPPLPAVDVPAAPGSAHLDSVK